MLLGTVDQHDLLTVLCSSPSLTWNVCSKMVYIILPMPKEGSITFGITSSTVDNKDRQKFVCYLSCHSQFPNILLLTSLMHESYRARSSGIFSHWPCPLWVWTSCPLSRWWTLCWVKTKIQRFWKLQNHNVIIRFPYSPDCLTLTALTQSH